MEFAAAALQFTTTAVQAFHGCVLAIEFFSTAQHMGADGDVLRVGLEFEKYRLMGWAKKVGLLDGNERQTLNWQLAGMTLKQLEAFLTSAHALRDRYSLDVTEEEVQAAEGAQAMEDPKRGVAKLIARLKPNLYTTASRIIQENNTTIKRLRWAARDRNKLKTFLGEIAGLINRLEFLLGDADRHQEKIAYDHFLREVISLTSTTVEAGQIEELFEDAPYRQTSEPAINAAAYLKQVRLVLGVDKRDDEDTPSKLNGTRMPKLAILGRSLKPWAQCELYSTSLEFATYHKRQVLIQWKSVESIQWENHAMQMKRLAVFMMSLSDDSFRSLPCLGYYPLEKQGRHGIVYSMPNEETDWDFRSLKDLTTTLLNVSLNRRLEIARQLSHTVLQLHTAGWLHKSLRSENIIFLAPRGSDPSVFLKNKAYITGYEYARTDTEDAAKEFTQLPDTELEADLYRHPQARGLNRETFQKRFDLYALGCIILELVAWEPLIDIFASFVNKELKSTMRIAQEQNEVMELPSLRDLFEKERAMELYECQAGRKVLEVIRACVEAKEVKKDDEGLLTDQIAIVEKLMWCRI